MTKEEKGEQNMILKCHLQQSRLHVFEMNIYSENNCKSKFQFLTFKV